MKIFLVDNEKTHLSRLRALIKDTFPDNQILPKKEDKIFTKWADVTRVIDSETKVDDDLIFIIDLGIESEEILSVSLGVEQAFGLKTLRPKAFFISYTQWGEYGQNQKHYSETFTGCIDKQTLLGFESIEEQRSYLRQIISISTAGFFGDKPSYTIRDSIGLRLAEAAFGKRAFDFLVQEVAKEWQNIELSSLTSGHSGAFLLSISGTFSGNRQIIIAKCARDEEIIRSETQNVLRHMAELGTLSEVITPSESTVHKLSYNQVCYYLQASITGESLLNHLASKKWNNKSRDILNMIISLELDSYKRKDGDSFGTLEPSKRFQLTPVDSGRALQSLEFLKKIAVSLQDNNQWLSFLPKPKEITDILSKVISNWKDIISKEDIYFCTVQHGDLNPGNVIVSSSGRVMLIDLNKLGHWPVGYDIARLATMLRIRLIDNENNRDWVINGLDKWINEGFCCIDEEKNTDRSICPPSVFCDQQIRRFFNTKLEAEKKILFRSYKVSTLWDLIKVLSYQDLSPFKRLWVLIESWRIASDLGFIKS